MKRLIPFAIDYSNRATRGLVVTRLLPLASTVSDRLRAVRYEVIHGFANNLKTLTIPVRYPPLQPVDHVPPHKIKLHLPGSATTRLRSFVWEDNHFHDAKPVFDDLWEKSSSFRAPYQMFVEKNPFRDTDQYQTMLAHLHSGKRYFMERYY